MSKSEITKTGTATRIVIYVASGLVLYMMSQWYTKVNESCALAASNKIQITNIVDTMIEIKDDVKYLVRESKKDQNR